MQSSIYLGPEGAEMAIAPDLDVPPGNGLRAGTPEPRRNPEKVDPDLHVLRCRTWRSGYANCATAPRW
jgi:hypothetical protein